MPKLFVHNFKEEPITLGIEPFADSEVLAPSSRAEFDYEAPAELIEFSLDEDNGATIVILSERVTLLANGGERTFTLPEGDW